MNVVRFDMLRAHGAISSNGSVQRDQIILHNGRNGMRFGKFEPTRLNILLTVHDLRNRPRHINRDRRSLYQGA